MRFFEMKNRRPVSLLLAALAILLLSLSQIPYQNNCNCSSDSPSEGACCCSKGAGRTGSCCGGGSENGTDSFTANCSCCGSGSLEAALLGTEARDAFQISKNGYGSCSQPALAGQYLEGKQLQALICSADPPPPGDILIFHVRLNT